MNRSKQIINIIEGFKLGSLGAGSRKGFHDVEEPEPQKSDTYDEPAMPTAGDDRGTRKIHNIKGKTWTWIDANQSNIADFIGGVKWKETNNHNFLLACFEKIGGEYLIRVNGGIGYKAPPQILYGKFSGVKPHSFVVVYTFKASNRDDAERYLSDIASGIVHAGSFGYALATGKLGSGWEVLTGALEWSGYVWETSRVKKSPHFKLK